MKQRGDQVDRFLVSRFLGAGEEGDVYLATDIRNGVKRTLKLLRGRDMVDDAQHTADYFRRLSRVRSVKRFRSWGVLQRQTGVGERAWLLFDYVHGVSLAEMLALGRVRSPLGLALRLCEALIPVHRLGLAIGDFDHGRNLIVERSTGLLKFCDLDAGTPHSPAPKLEDDLGETLSLTRTAYRCLGTVMPKTVRVVIEESRSVFEAQRELAGLLRRVR